MVLHHIKRGFVKAAAVSVLTARKVKHAVLGSKGSKRRSVAKRAAKRVARKLR